MRDKLPILIWLIPAGIAAAYALLFVVHLHRNITELFWDPDYPSAFTLPETLASAGSSGHTVISSSGQWVSLWFGLLTAKLPLHRQLWDIAPTALFIVSALIVGWSVAQLATRRAAILAVLLIVIASQFALIFFMAPVAHNTVYPCTALLGAYVVWLSLGEDGRRLSSWAVPAIMGVVVGVCLASDVLLAVTAIVPLTVTAILAGVQHDRRSRVVGLSALATVAVAVPVALITTSVMHSLGYLTLPTPAKFVPLAELPDRARLLFKGLGDLFNGYLGGPKAPGGLHEALGLASDVVMSAALLALIVLGVRAGAMLIWAAIRRRSAASRSEQARSLHVVYWVASGASACGAFWIAAETGGGTDLHESYYATVIFSVAAVISLLLSGGALRQHIVAAGASIFFLASFVGLTGNYMNLDSGLAAKTASVVRIAQANHVTYGYGGYGTSSFTWISRGRVTVRPLMTCENPSGANICPFYLMSTPAWYVPQERHTFLLTLSGEGWVSSLPAGLGKPLSTYRLGALSMYIYPYDIASRLGPQQD